MVLDSTASPTTKRREQSDRSGALFISYHPYYTVCESYLNKEAKKLIKLQSKAQECVSRKKAQKILKKSDKLHSKLT